MELIGKTINNRYKISDKIGEDFLSTFWKAQRLSTNDEVAIRFLKQDNISHRVEELIRLKKATTSIAQINHPNINKIFEIDEYTELPNSLNILAGKKRYTYIVSEYIDGLSLAGYILIGKIPEYYAALELIEKIGEALKVIHENGIVHRDLCPKNIWIVSKNNHIDQAKVSGFGFVEFKELSGINMPEDIISAFSYMSPEACGIVNKKIDDRSDLYSLGIIFYQLLTGELPFQGGDVNSIVHKHIAMTPLSPSKLNNTISPDLDKIVLKLLSKDQENRYQSAIGLLCDLQKIKNGDKDFEPGIEDRKVTLNYRSSLIGRENEINAFKEMFDRAGDYAGSFCLIGGEAGSGKTRLVEELKGYIFDKGGIFISGKCFADDNTMPYQIFRDAIDEFLDYYQRLNFVDQKDIQDRIRVLAGDLGEIVINLNPLMKDILGEVQPLVKLDPDKENERFLMVLSDFFGSLGRLEASVVLFLDDLQWADDGSMSLLSEIINKVNKFPLFIIGAYRNNEISEDHRLNRIRDDYPEITEFNMNLFDTPELNNLIANIIGIKDSEATEELTNYLFEKSKGNPFFAIEMIRQFVDEKVIYPGDKNWEIDIEKLEGIEVPATIVEIVLRRIKLLNEDEKAILSYGAIIGSKIEIELLFKLGRLDYKQILNTVDKAIDLQLLDENPFEKGKLFFAHDRVRDAFDSDISDKKRRLIHLEIAEVMEQEEKTDEVIFSLARHYTSGGDSENSLKYSMPAAHHAKEKYANEEAIKYYRLALKLLEEKGQKESGQWIELKEKLGEIYLIIGKYNEAIEIFNILLPYMSSNIKKANIYAQIHKAFFKMGNWRECEQYAKKGLELLGEKLPINRTAVLLSIIKEFATHVLHNLFPKFFIRNMENPEVEYKIIIRLYHTINWAYILFDVFKFTRSILRMLNVAERRIGRSNELGLSIGAYASLCMAIPLFKRSIKYQERALKLKEELDDKWGIAQSLQFLGFCYGWKGESTKGIHYFNESVDRFKRLGDIREIGMSTSGNSHCSFFLSDYRQTEIETDKCVDIAKTTNDSFQLSAVSGWIARYLLELGEFKEAEYYGLKSFNSSYDNEDWFPHCMANIVLGYLYLERGNIQRAWDFILEAKKLFEGNNFLKQYTVYLYTVIAEAYIAEYSLGPGSERKKRKLYLNKIKKSCNVALRKTKSWITNYSAALRVNAKYYALIGENRKAEKLFLQSIDLDNTLGRRYELAKSYYEYGLFLNNTSSYENAKIYWQYAYSIFEEIGSKVYLKRTADLLMISDRGNNEFLNKRRLSSAIIFSQQISSILNIEGLLENIVAKAIELTGSMRGFLFIFNDETNELELRSSKNIEQKAAKKNGLQYSKEVIYDVYNNNKVVIIHNSDEDNNPVKYDDLKSTKFKSILGIPIILHEKTIGVFYSDNRLSSSVFTEDDIELLNIFFSQAAISIENAGLFSSLENRVEKRTKQLQMLSGELESANKKLADKNRILSEVAHRDSLTGLLNHAALLERLQSVFSQSRRHNFPVSVVMIDVDFFKKFNDTYGHHVGDEILLKVSSIFISGLRDYDVAVKYSNDESEVLKDEIRKYDVAGRYGGDEFIIVLSCCGNKEALIVTERLRRRIEEISLVDIPEARITATLGIAVLDENASCDDSKKLVRLADKALYNAKMEGRNQICFLKYE